MWILPGPLENLGWSKHGQKGTGQPEKAEDENRSTLDGCPTLRKRRSSELQLDDDWCGPGDAANDAATSLLMLKEPADDAAPSSPFFQFPRVAPPILVTSQIRPPVKRTCFQFGTNAPSVLTEWPQCSATGNGPSPCGSPRPRVRTACNAELKEALNKMVVQARLSSSPLESEEPPRSAIAA